MARKIRIALCHDCLEEFAEKDLFTVPRNEGKSGAHSVNMCKGCCKKEKINTKKLETTRETRLRIKKFTGL